MNVLCCALLLSAFVARAESEPEDELPAPPRLALIEGEASFWRPGAEEWVAAKANVPLAPGDRLFTDRRSRLEVQIGASAWLRADQETEVGLENLERDFTQFRMGKGSVSLDIRQMPEGHTFEIDTPAAALTINREGYYRIDVDEDDDVHFIARRGGSGDVRSPAGVRVLSSGEELVLHAAEEGRLDSHAAGDLDEFDGWSDGRTDRLLARRGKLPPDMYGVEDLDEHGDWRDVPRFGRVWVPARVPSDWYPYSTGRWMWDPIYGWTWVDDYLWGYAPYHYGRWVWVDTYWAWTPGPVVVRPVYAPALVAFFETPSVSVGVTFGSPGVAWVALGWGEPVIPWWGPRHIIGHPWWGGWYGPRVVNEIVIEHTHVVHVHEIHHYTHARRYGGRFCADRDEFARGRFRRLDHVDAARLTPIRGELPVRPKPLGLVPAERAARRPPRTIESKPVVATRPPRDPAHRLKEAGLSIRPEAAGAAPVRVLEPRHTEDLRRRSLERGSREERGRGRTAESGEAGVTRDDKLDARGRRGAPVGTEQSGEPPSAGAQERGRDRERRMRERSREQGAQPSGQAEPGRQAGEGGGARGDKVEAPGRRGAPAGERPAEDRGAGTVERRGGERRSGGAREQTEQQPTSPEGERGGRGRARDRWQREAPPPPGLTRERRERGEREGERRYERRPPAELSAPAPPADTGAGRRRPEERAREAGERAQERQGEQHGRDLRREGREQSAPANAPRIDTERSRPGDKKRSRAADAPPPRPERFEPRGGGSNDAPRPSAPSRPERFERPRHEPESRMQVPRLEQRRVEPPRVGGARPEPPMRREVPRAEPPRTSRGEARSNEAAVPAQQSHGGRGHGRGDSEAQ